MHFTSLSREPNPTAHGRRQVQQRKPTPGGSGPGARRPTDSAEEPKDGTHAVLLDPLDLIARLCTLVPPPRVHMLRYHGVLAANANMARRSEATSTCAWQAQQTGGENPRPGALMQGTRHRRGKGVDLEHQVPGSGEAARQAPVGPVRGGPVDP